MRKLIIAAMCVLAGCASGGIVDKDQPISVQSSSLSANDAVACLTTALAARWNKAWAAQETRFVAQVVVPNVEYDVVPTGGMVSNHYIFTVNVKSKGSGSEFRLFKINALLGNVSDAMKQGMKDCAGA